MIGKLMSSVVFRFAERTSLPLDKINGIVFLALSSKLSTVYSVCREPAWQGINLTLLMTDQRRL